MLDQQPRFKISSIGLPLKSFLEVDADLVEWALKVPMPIPAFLRTFPQSPAFLYEPKIVECTTGLCGLTKLSKSWEHSSPDLKPSVQEIYSSNVLTTPLYAWYETVGGALPLL